jgi:hypothetical protein
MFPSLFPLFHIDGEMEASKERKEEREMEASTKISYFRSHQLFSKLI